MLVFVWLNEDRRSMDRKDQSKECFILISEDIMDYSTSIEILQLPMGLDF
jgi:hypothetical protein